MGKPGSIEPDDLKSIPTFRAAYSDRTALLMARLAQRAYEPFHEGGAAFDTFPDELREIGLADFLRIVDPEVGTAGFVTAGPELIAVVFRGTEDSLDWRTNVRLAWVVLQGGVQVHTGFFQAYWPVRTALFDEIVRLIEAKPRPVYLTGHSLGGALAAMATAELANHDKAEVRDFDRRLLHLRQPKSRRPLLRPLREGSALPHHQRRRSRARGAAVLLRLPAGG